MRPDGLNTLPMSHSDTVHVGEVKFCLAQSSMADDVELGNCDTERVEGLDVNGANTRVFQEAIGQVLPPLAANVVGHDNVPHPCIKIICESGCKGVVDINISGTTVS